MPARDLVPVLAIAAIAMTACVWLVARRVPACGQGERLAVTTTARFACVKGY